MSFVIREASDRDFAGIWPIFREIVAAGETYPYAPDTGEDEARTLWLTVPRATYVAVDSNDPTLVLGTYYIKPNQPGLGDHVCNVGYMVSSRARQRGMGRALCEHSLRAAKDLGFLAMQFNLVIASNVHAVALWKKMGFSVIGTVPQAFRHHRLGLVDALIMHQAL